MSKPKEKYYQIFEDKGSKVATILIYGVIGYSFFEESITARQFAADLLNMEKYHTRANVRLNTPGGSVFDGNAMFNAIKRSKMEIHTYNDGMCASMGAVLMFAAKKENRHPAKNSLTMVHSPLTGVWGNRKQIEAGLVVLDKCQDTLVTSICENDDLDKKEVEKKYFDYEDHWFTAQEAMDEGFYSQLEETEAENVPQNVLGMNYNDLFKLYEPSNHIFIDWYNRVSPVTSIETTTEEILDFIDMDIKKLTAAYKLPEDSTEDAILAHVTQREQEIATLTTAKTKAENELATANQTIAAKDAEIVALKKEPGAAPATAPVDTDPKPPTNGDPEPAGDFRSAFADCIEILKPKK